MTATFVLPLTQTLVAFSSLADTVLLSAVASTVPETGVSAALVTANLVTVGTGLFVDQELMKVMEVLTDPIGVKVRVLRGQGGSQAQPHNSSAPVTIGSMDKFYSNDPMGRPRDAVLVSPWINTRNGNVWMPQGDSVPGATYRWWQNVTNTYGYGPLGVRTQVSSPGYGT